MHDASVYPVSFRGLGSCTECSLTVANDLRTSSTALFDTTVDPHAHEPGSSYCHGVKHCLCSPLLGEFRVPHWIVQYSFTVVVSIVRFCSLVRKVT